MNKREENTRAVEAFLNGLTRNSVDLMPFAPHVILKSPLDPLHPSIGEDAVRAFLTTRVFPEIPVQRADVERHIVEGDYVATLWTALFNLQGREVSVPIFDLFRVSGGLIHEVRPYFDPAPLKNPASFGGGTQGR